MAERIPRWKILSAAALIALAGAGASRTAHSSPVDAIPFPVHRSTSLDKEGTVYFIEGRVRIPKGIEISVQKDIRIVGRGKNAVLEVAGELQVHGTFELRVSIQDVRIELSPVFGEVHIDACVMGGSGGVFTDPEKPADGRLFIENTTFNTPATVDITFSANQIDLQRVLANAPVKIRAVDPGPGKPNKVKLMLMHCWYAPKTDGGFMGGLSVEGVYDATIRNNLIRGKRCVMTDCDKLTFDANKVKSPSLEFTQTESGRFNKSKMQKCDIYSARVSLSAPADGKSIERLTIDKCWFRGETTESVLRETVFNDRDDNPEVGVRAKFKKISKSINGLAGKEDK